MEELVSILSCKIEGFSLTKSSFPYKIPIFKLRVGAFISRFVCPSVCPWEKCQNCKKSVKKSFVKCNDHLSMYAHESSMKLSFGATLDTRTACKALKKIKELYMKRTKTFEYKSIVMQ